MESADGSVDPRQLPSGSRPTPLLKEASRLTTAKPPTSPSLSSPPLPGRKAASPLTLSVRPNGSPGGLEDNASRQPKPGWQVVTRKKRPPGAQSPTTVPSGADEIIRSNAHAATSLYRKGASNPLYRQAVAVYAERIRKDTRVAQEAASACYDQLVDSQSTSVKIDLHGVPVIDGVRIAKSRIWHWWESLDREDRGRIAAIDGFTIVTGVGHHSSGGISRLRQAVGTALRNDGWRMQTLTGEFFITGRV